MRTPPACWPFCPCWAGSPASWSADPSCGPQGCGRTGCTSALSTTVGGAARLERSIRGAPRPPKTDELQESGSCPPGKPLREGGGPWFRGTTGRGRLCALQSPSGGGQDTPCLGGGGGGCRYGSWSCQAGFLLSRALPAGRSAGTPAGPRVEQPARGWNVSIGPGCSRRPGRRCAGRWVSDGGRVPAVCCPVGDGALDDNPHGHDAAKRSCKD